MPNATNRDVNLHYEVMGQGEPLLLVPGLGSDVSNWPGMDRLLAERFQVIRMDNRGAGRSDCPPPPYFVADMAADCAAVLDDLGLESAHVLGHSMGGCIALEMALELPQMVRRLVLGSTTARLAGRNAQLFDAWVELIRAGCDPELVTREIMLWMYPVPLYESPTFLEGLVRECMDYPHLQPFDGLVGQVEALKAFDARERLEGVQVPTLVLHGEMDQLVPPAEGVDLGRKVPGAGVEILDETGHLPHRQFPDRYAEAVARFLSAAG